MEQADPAQDRSPQVVVPVARDAEIEAQRGSLAETLEQSIPRAITPLRRQADRSREQIFPLWRQRLRLAARHRPESIAERPE